MTPRTESIDTASPGEVDNPPRGPRRSVGRWVVARRKGRDDIVRLARAPVRLPAQGGEIGDDLGELVGVLEVDGEEALVSGGPAAVATIAGAQNQARLTRAAYVFALIGTVFGLTIALLRGLEGLDIWIHLVMLVGLAAGFVLMREQPR